MKKRKIDLLTIIGIVCIFSSMAFSQQTVSLLPNPEQKAECPNINVVYEITNYVHNCYSVEIQNGIIVEPLASNGKFTARWNDTGDKGKIIITKDGGSTCVNAKNGNSFNVPIRTLALATPTLAGPLNAAAGFQHVLAYQADLNWPWRGTLDPNPFKVNSFNWTLPLGWTNNSVPPTQAAINTTTNIGGGGVVTATGISTCGAGAFNSNPGTRTVNRTLSVPCPLVSQRQSEKCGEPGPNFFAANSQPAGYSSNNPQWSWSLPQGWTFNGTPNSQYVFVNTNGQNGGNVVATYSDWGVSASCPLEIPLVLANPGTFADGDDKLCVTEIYSLTNLPLAAGASATWAVSPSNAPVYPLSGTGTNATLTALDGATPGSAAIGFTVTGCGLTETYNKSFYVGKPTIYQHRINNILGYSQTVCPGWHLLSAQMLGADPACMTWELVNNQGSPPHALPDMFCNWASIYLNPMNNAPAFVKVTAENDCGPTSSYFYLYPHLPNCKDQYYFLLYPNPASSILHLEVLFDDGQGDAIPLTIGHVQLITMVGTIALDLPNADSQAVELDLSLVPSGLYVARAQVGGQWLTEKVQVTKN